LITWVSTAASHFLSARAAGSVVGVKLRRYRTVLGGTYFTSARRLPITANRAISIINGTGTVAPSF
jgi:hypothetical protein